MLDELLRGIGDAVAKSALRLAAVAVALLGLTVLIGWAL